MLLYQILEKGKWVNSEQDLRDTVKRRKDKARIIRGSKNLDKE